jgi:prepilin-type processing-associated H-X9-DG protein
MATYVMTSSGYHPASYLYPEDSEGNWKAASQDAEHPYGYVHWSHFLYEDGAMEDKGFQCPAMDGGGAPRTNPGLHETDWQIGEQVDQNGEPNPNELTDKQAPRMAYTANAAIIPRNKFDQELSGGSRVNTFVPEQRIKRPGGTVLMTEFLDNWKALSVPKGDKLLVKSHQPINPFYHVSSGFNEYTAPRNTAGFMYGLPSDQNTYGLLDNTEVRHKVNILDHTSGIAQVNAIGRHHPGGDKRLRDRFGGTANFLFSDGHVEPLMVLETLRRRMWGDRYYSLSGKNQVMNMHLTQTRNQ